jgi:uncharacterized membrane protein YgcG
MNAKKSKTALQFIPNVARKTEGLSDAGIEQFRDNPYVSCGRETGQNTNDAPDAGKRPVIMKFDLRRIPRVEVPFADELAAATQACLDQSIDLCKKTNRDLGKDRTVRFFERAKSSLSNEALSILEIADFNTTGLTGPFEDDHCVFNSLVKAKGITNKANTDSGGSFGIGKNAVFAVSDVQTVLYSTKARNLGNPNAADEYAFQSRTVLISHENGGVPNAAEGFWGLPDYYPIRKPSDVPEWMLRSERGTSIFAICFREHPKWAERMALSIATNFSISVMRGDMEFEIDNGRFNINKSTLLSILNDKALENVAKEANQLVSLERARNIYNCLTSESRERYLIPVQGYGNAVLNILVQDELPRQVNIVRNGMFITNSLKDFGCPLTSFPSTKEFVAVVEPEAGSEGKLLGELLKRMENPEHDNFSPERLRDDQEREAVTKLIKKLHGDIREKIRSVAKVASSDHSNIDELAKLFAADPDSGDAKEEAEKDPEQFTYGKAKITKRKPAQQTTKTGGTEGGSGGSGGSGGGTGGGSGGGTGTGGGTGGAGEKGKAKAKVIRLTECRARREPSNAQFSHRIFFTPTESGDAQLNVRASGLTSATPLAVEESDAGVVTKGKLALSCEKDVRVSIKLAFEGGYEGPLEFSCHIEPSEVAQ